MKYYIAFLLSFLFFLNVNAQQKELTLKDAVMEQYGKFYPQNIKGFQWIPGTTSYTFLENRTTLKKGYADNKNETEDLSIAEVNKALSSDLKNFSELSWKNSDAFYLTDNNSYYLYDYSQKKGQLISKIDASAENSTLQKETGNIAYTVDNNLYIQKTDGSTVTVTKNSDTNIVSGQAIARSEFGITNGIFWSPKGNFLAFYQKDETEVSDYPLVNINPTPGELNSIKYPMAGQKSERPKVGIYNLATQQTVFISPTGNVDDYLTNLSWAPDEKNLLIAELNRDQNHMKLQLFDATTGKLVRTILEERNDRWVEPEHPAYFYSNSSEDFIWMSEKDGFMNLYLCNTTKGFVKQLTKNKWVAEEIVGNNSKGTEVYFSGTGESPLDTKMYSVSISNGKQACLTQTSGTHNASMSTDGKYIFDQYSNHETPSVAQVLDNRGKTIQTFVKAESPMAEYKIGITEIGKLKSHDGFDLYTRLIKPSNFDPTKKYPVLVYVYGGTHAQLITNAWNDGASLWMKWMAEQGYLVFTLDGRGSANRGFAFESVIHRQLGTEELKDQLVGVEYLKSLPYVDSDRLAMHGWSFGGFMTVSMMLRNPGVFTTGVAGGPVTDWKYYEVMYGERYMDTPQQNPKGYEIASLLNKTQNLTGKLLTIHGSIDPVVVMQHDLSLIKSFVENEKQMDFFVYPMHEHNVRGKDRVHLMTKVLNYVIENNK
ncbi:DPP IV N-terminal domain-containing protein [Aequorivita sp. CIP111184]|uniref:S9 family peptidase n=1 Tax=Aequorivita sp. CIP111184 TaxID=2211356 RepID=UPI000DBC27D7|nr:DPP IV N-terminal domain-containing protein [Aequorivita sp. CIP111184]SRX54454.1 Prolyl tripeptidyl peptidase [Aequorivita sp. CIP111184]